MDEEFMYPVGDFNIQLIDVELYRVVLFLNIYEDEWYGIDDHAVYMYKYGMQRGRWNAKDVAIEMETGYDGVRYIIMLLKKYKGIDPEMIDMMYDTLAEAYDNNYALV